MKNQTFQMTPNYHVIDDNNTKNASGTNNTDNLVGEGVKFAVNNCESPKANLPNTFLYSIWTKLLERNSTHSSGVLCSPTELSAMKNDINDTDHSGEVTVDDNTTKMQMPNEHITANFDNTEKAGGVDDAKLNTVGENNTVAFDAMKYHNTGSVLLFYSLLQRQIRYQILKQTQQKQQQQQQQQQQQNPDITVNNNNININNNNNNDSNKLNAVVNKCNLGLPSTPVTVPQVGGLKLPNWQCSSSKNMMAPNAQSSFQFACFLQQYQQQNLLREYMQKAEVPASSSHCTAASNTVPLTVDSICDNLQQRIQYNKDKNENATVKYEYSGIGNNNNSSRKVVAKKRNIPYSSSKPLRGEYDDTNEKACENQNVKWHTKSRELWRKWSLESCAGNDSPNVSSMTTPLDAKDAIESDKVGEVNVFQLYANNCDLKNGSNNKANGDTDTGVAGFECARCGKMFSYAYYRDKHLKYTRCVDNGDRKFPCALCSRSFEKRDRLRIHVLHVHENHRPHVCATCGKAFSQSSSLNKHLRVHSGERPYHCPFCTKCFTASSILRTHIRQHSGEKPFKCVFCGKSFASHAAHDSHVRRTHATPPHSTVSHGAPCAEVNSPQ